MFGINGMEGVVLLILAALLFGDRLPEYSRTLAGWVRNVRAMSEDAKTRLKEEVPEIQDLNWRQYDPRQYDPRTIIKNALTEDLDPPAQSVPADPSSTTAAPAMAHAAPSAPVRPFEPLPAGEKAPFDMDAT